MILMMLLMTNMMFIFMNHPMSMGLTLIMQTIFMAILSGMIMKSFWMSYILLITMLSGMIVLFIYMSSIASNEKFKNSIKMWIMIMIMVIMTMMFLFLNEKMIIKNNYLSMEMFMNKNFCLSYLNKMFIMNNMIITIMMVAYLLLTMIVSSFLVNISEGPMRLKV